MHSLGLDIRYALRMLAKRPVSTSAILLTLGLAIGGSVSIFSVVNGVLLSPLPFKDSDRLVAVWTKNPEGDERGDVAPADFRDFQQQASSFDEIAAASTYFDVNLTGGGDPERLDAAIVSSNLLSVLGVKPERGRGFEPRHERAGAERVVLLGHGLWQRRFGSDPDIVSKQILLNGEGYTVLGVLPENLRFPDSESQLWMPLSFLADRMEQRSQSFLFLVTRLKPGVGLEAGRAELESIARRLATEYPDSNAGRDVTVIPLREAMIGNVRLGLYLLFAAIGCVLLIACANIASLMLGQALGRQREVALRVALGAGRFQSARQALVECVILALLGGGLGLLLTHWALSALLSLSSKIPRVEEIGIDARVLGFTLLISLLTGLLAGTLPALRTARPNLNQSLKEGGRTTAGSRQSRLRSSLIVGEIALSLVLLIGAGLLIKSFSQLLAVQPGFDPQNVLTVRVSLPSTAYPEASNRTAFFQQLVDGIATMPGVDAVGATSRLPMTEGNITTSLTVEGHLQEGSPPEAGLRLVDKDYFRAMRIPVLGGRPLTDADGAVEAETVALVNHTLAERFWPKQSAVGRRIKLGPPDPENAWITVVGVVADVHHFGLETKPEPEVYLHSDQVAPGGMTLVVRTDSDPHSLVPSIRQAVAALDPDLPVYDVNTLEEILSGSVAERRFPMLLLGIFATIALALAVVGIYGGIAAWVAQHRHEIGTRLALGAQRPEILGLVVGRGMALTGAGLILGLITAFWLRSAIQTLLFEIDSADPQVFVAVPLFLAIVALLACGLPAWRAARVDPMIALREE